MLKLVQNEVTKMMLSKKPYLIVTLLIIFIGLFAYGEQYSYDKSIERLVMISEDLTFNWENLARQQIRDMEKRITSPYMSEEGKKSIQIEVEQLKYFLDNGINPITPSAAKFAVQFVEQGIVLLIPLLIIILAADLVSGEFSTKSIKILMTKAVPRWKILMSKFLALSMMTTLVLFLSAVLAVGISKLFFGRWGFDEPVITGFIMNNGNLLSDQVIKVSQFEYMILIYSLAWFVALIIGCITFMISVLVKSTPAAIGIIMAALIGGQFLQFFLADWEVVKYFFVSNLNLTKYLTGSYQFIEGMSFGFSIGVLSIWGLVALAVSFIVFSKKDILV